MNRAYNRDVSRRKALRKRRIAREVCHGDYYDNLHQYSKNKIHCSCPLCNSKTRNKGRRKKGNYNRSINYSRADLRRQIAMDYSEEEYSGKKIHRRTRYW